MRRGSRSASSPRSRRADDARIDPVTAFARFLDSGKSAGAICVSLGLASNFADVERFLRFAGGFRDQPTLTIGAVTFDIESCRVIRDGS
jgi:hypothetical protein